MTKTRFALILATLVITIVASACNRDDSEPEEPSTARTPQAQSPAPAAANGEIAYEPAYPEEVSTDGLSEEDVAQQEASHSHGGGEEHSHGEGGHSHEPAAAEEADHYHENDHDH